MSGAWRPLDAPSAQPATAGRPSRCPDDEVVKTCTCDVPSDPPGIAHRHWCDLEYGEPPPVDEHHVCDEFTTPCWCGRYRDGGPDA